MKTFYKVTAILLFMSLGGCASISESGYYWGNYSHTYNAYLKSPSKETTQAHVESLLDIVKTSNEKGLKCPPGIYAELGYISQKEGGNKEAEQYYNKEIQLYPESKTFISKLYSNGK